MADDERSTTNDDSLSLDHMRAFIALVETGSQVRAAERLRIAQTTVGRHVERVQAHFGGNLFETGTGARLSTRGLIVERSIRFVLAELSHSRDRLAVDRPVLRIGFIRIMRPIVERALRTSTKKPGDDDWDVRLIELQTGPIAQRFRARELDIAVSYAFDNLFEEPGGIEESVVTEQPFALVVPERACLRGNLVPSRLASLDYAHLPRRFSNEVADSGLRWLRENRLEPKSSIECELGTEILAYAATGRGYGFLPALWKTASHDGAVFVPLPGFARAARIVAYSLKHVRPRVTRFRESLLEAARAALDGFP